MRQDNVTAHKGTEVITLWIIARTRGPRPGALPRPAGAHHSAPQGAARGGGPGSGDDAEGALAVVLDCRDREAFELVAIVLPLRWVLGDSRGRSRAFGGHSGVSTDRRARSRVRRVFARSRGDGRAWSDPPGPEGHDALDQVAAAARAGRRAEGDEGRPGPERLDDQAARELEPLPPGDLGRGLAELLHARARPADADVLAQDGALGRPEGAGGGGGERDGWPR